MGGSSSGARDRVGIYDASGVFQRTVRRIVRVVGPASYAAGGFQVDCSAYFSSIVAARPLRIYTTATLAVVTGRVLTLGEAGSDLFSAAKFRAVVLTGGGHTHTYDKANTPTATPSGNPTGFGADNDHTHALTYTSTASGSSSTNLFAESTGSTSLAVTTSEFEVEGVPL